MRVSQVQKDSMDLGLLWHTDFRNIMAKKVWLVRYCRLAGDLVALALCNYCTLHSAVKLWWTLCWGFGVRPYPVTWKTDILCR